MLPLRPSASSAPRTPQSCRRSVGGGNAPYPPSTSYDIGALKALYYHVRTALDEKRTKTRRLSRRVQSRAPEGWKEESAATPRECVPDTNALGCDDGQNGRITDGESDSEDTSDIGGSKGRFDGGVAAAESACVFDGVDRRLSDLEIDIFPHNAWERGTGQDGHSPSGPGARDKLTRLEEHSATTVSPAQRAGGAFARLVVIKELQPVPAHAPEEARHLLELALDHHQVRCRTVDTSVTGKRVLNGTLHQKQL